MSAISVCIAIGTYKRPIMLRRALESLVGLEIPKGVKAFFVLCDNEEEQSGFKVFREFESRFEFSSFYMHEPRRGLSFMRNAVLSKAIENGASHLACFDDDQEVSSDCLQELFLCMDNYQADVVSGKVNYQWPVTTNVPENLRYFSRYPDERATGTKLKFSGTGNVLVNLSLVKALNLRFDNKLNFIGGEDQLFFETLYDHGAKIVACREAVVNEEVPASRANMTWIYLRNRRFGHTKYYIKTVKEGSLMARLKTFLFLLTELPMCYLIYFRFPFSGFPFRVRHKKRINQAIGFLEAMLGKKHYEFKNIHGS